MPDPVISEYDINTGQAMAGIYYRSDGTNCGTSFLRRVVVSGQQRAANPFPFFLPFPDVSICCSSGGLLLCRSLRLINQFYILNPATERSTILTRPAVPMLPNCPVALVCYNAGARYICKVLCGVSHPYGLCTFSTLTGQWLWYPLPGRYGNIIPNSGVSCGAKVYFRTDQLNLIEISTDDEYRVQCWALPGPETCVEMGRIGGDLCLVAVTSTHILIEFRSPGVSHWYCWQFELEDIATEGSFSLSGAVIKPLRFESEMYEFPLLVNGRPVVLEFSRPNPDVRVRAWALPFDGLAPERAEDCVTFLNRPGVMCGS